LLATPDCPADNQARQLALFFIRDVVKNAADKQYAEKNTNGLKRRTFKMPFLEGNKN